MALPKRSFTVAAGATTVAYVGAGGVNVLTVAEVTAVAAPATMYLYDQAAGPVATDPIAIVRLAANRQRQLEFPKGLRFRLGLLVEAVGGDVNGNVSFGGSGVLTPRFFDADANALVTGPVNVDSILVADVGGAAASAVIYDALTAVGGPFASVSLTANEDQFLRWPQGVSFGTGITVDISGAVEGVIYTL